MLGHKTSFNKFKKIGIISSIFSDHNAMKQGFNYKKNTEKHTKTWKLNNMLLSKEIKKEWKDTLKNENEDATMQNLWDTGKAIRRGKFIAFTGLSQKTRKR